MPRLLLAVAVLIVVVGGVYWIVTAPTVADAAVAPDADADTARGEQVFWAAGCSSCHAAEDAEGDDKLRLGGGQAFPSEFGTFRAPNISQDPTDGIGDWTAEEFLTAVKHGVSPGGEHYFPVFPYGAYSNATDDDVLALFAYMKTLPAVTGESEPHDVSFPFNIRRNLGGWKWLFQDDDWVLTGDLTDQQQRGRYLVEALGHCGECHTPRTRLGALKRSEWLSGAPNPTGKGNIPNITPAGLSWSEGEIAYYLESGFTPEYDTAGGHMVPVIDNFSRLPAEDREAVAAYLKAVPAVETAPEPEPASE